MCPTPKVSTLMHQELKFLRQSPLSNLRGAMSTELGNPLYHTALLWGLTVYFVWLFYYLLSQLSHVCFQVFKSAFMRQNIQTGLSQN